jgi:hypothetical protein
MCDRVVRRQRRTFLLTEDYLDLRWCFHFTYLYENLLCPGFSQGSHGEQTRGLSLIEDRGQRCHVQEISRDRLTLARSLPDILETLVIGLWGVAKELLEELGKEGLGIRSRETLPTRLQSGRSGKKKRKLMMCINELWIQCAVQHEIFWKRHVKVLNKKFTRELKLKV